MAIKYLTSKNIFFGKSILILIFFNCFLISAQEKYPYNKWTPQELTLAKSGNSNQFMDSIETEILMYCNLVRVNPKLFCETYFKEYIDKKQIDIVAEKYVEMCADYGVDDEIFKESMGNDQDLDKAIMYYLDIEEDEDN